ncbi:MAG: hypothetical protein ACRD0P_04605, partial [Stackebrandtia sp.]
HTSVDLPDDAAAERTAQQAIPGMGTEVYGDRSLFFWEGTTSGPMDSVFAIDDGDDYNAGFLSYTQDHASDDFARIREAKERLTAAGWEIQSVREESDYAAFTATRDGLDIEVSTQVSDPETEVVDDPSKPSKSDVSISRATPAPAPVLTVAGLVIGGLVGWAVAVRLLRQASRWPTAWRAIASGTLGVGGFLLAVPTVINLYYVALSLIMPEERVPVWLGYTFGPPAIAALLGAAALAASILCGLVPKLTRLAARRGSGLTEHSY